jgi:hypothetical protein
MQYVFYSQSENHYKIIEVQSCYVSLAKLGLYCLCYMSIKLFIAVDSVKLR